MQAAVDEATAALAEATRSCERLTFDLSRLEEERAQARQRVDVALAKLHESDATLAAVAESSEYGSQARSAKGEAERLAKAIEAAEAARDKDLAGLADLEQRLLAAEEEAPEDDPDTTERERLAEEAPRARRRWTPASRCAPRRSGACAVRPGRLADAGRAGRARRPGEGRRPARRLAREGRVAEAVGRA